MNAAEREKVRELTANVMTGGYSLAVIAGALLNYVGLTDETFDEFWAQLDEETRDELTRCLDAKDDDDDDNDDDS